MAIALIVLRWEISDTHTHTHSRSRKKNTAGEKETICDFGDTDLAISVASIAYCLPNLCIHR